MTKQFWFWILMVLWFFYGAWVSWPVSDANRRSVGGSLLLFVIIGLLGWQVFGDAVK